MFPTVSKPVNISKVFLPCMWISENREKLNDFSSPPIRVQYLITCHSLWPMRGQYLVEKKVQRPPPFDIVSTWKNIKKTYHIWKLKNFPFLEIRKILYSWKLENFLVSKFWYIYLVCKLKPENYQTYPVLYPLSPTKTFCLQFQNQSISQRFHYVGRG